MMKNILMVCQYASPNKYGFGSRHFHLGREFQKSGHKFRLVIGSFNHLLHTPKVMKSLFFEREHVEDIDVIWIRTFSYKNTRSLIRVFNWFWFSLMALVYMSLELGRRIDVTIVSSPSPVAVVGAKLGSILHRARLIFEIRDIWPLTFIHVGHVSPKHPLVVILGFIEKFAYSQADVITSTLPKADAHIRSVIQKDFNFKCIPQGIDPVLLSNNMDEEKFRSLFDAQKFNVIYAGTLAPSNNLPHFIDVIRLLHEKGQSNFHFYILGSGVEEVALKKKAADLPNLTFVSRVSKAEVQSFLTHADVLYDSTLPEDLYKFGLSKNKWIDYMLAGKPIVASYSGHVSLINEANCGVVVPANDNGRLHSTFLEFSSMSAESRSVMGARGREYVLKNRTFKELAGEYETLF